MNADIFNNLQEEGVYAFYYSDDSDGFGITFYDWYGRDLDDITEAMEWWHDMAQEFGVDEQSLYDIVWIDELEDQEYIDAEDYRNARMISEALAGDPGD